MYYCTFIEGRKYDAGILADSHLLEELELNAYSPDVYLWQSRLSTKGSPSTAIS